MKTATYLAVIAYLGITTTTLVKAVRLEAFEGEDDQTPTPIDQPVQVDGAPNPDSEVARLFDKMNQDGNG